MLAFLTKHRPGYIPAIGWLILCTILLCLPGSRFPTYNWLTQIQFDKWVHIGLFGILVLLMGWGYWSRTLPERNLTAPIVACVILATAYGVGMEFIQDHLIPNRSFDLGDIWADAAGSILGGWLAQDRFKKKPL